MAYKNWKDYEENDGDYLIRVLRDELHRVRPKITFEDGTTYHVTKSGSRYWQMGGKCHNEYGPAMVFGRSSYHYLHSVELSSEDYPNALARLIDMRTITNNCIEPIMEIIERNTSYQVRIATWKALLLSDIGSVDILHTVTDLSAQYDVLEDCMIEFIEDNNVNVGGAAEPEETEE